MMADSNNDSEKPMQDPSPLDSRIDRALRELILESENCLKMNFLVGASACLRKAIHELLEKEQSWVEQPNGRINYRESVIALKGKFPRVPPEYFDALSGIEQMASDKVHEGSWQPWSPERLRALLDVTKNVLHEMYVISLEQKARAAVVSRMLGELKADKGLSAKEEDAGKRAASESKPMHDARIAQTAQQNEGRRQERLRYIDNAVAALTSDVLPILEQAAVSFRKRDIETAITKDFDVKNQIEKNPSVMFKCLGRRADGSRFEAPAAFFSSDGAVIAVEMATGDHAPKENLGSAARGESDALVTRGVERALSAYFALEKHR
jgi:hypothetical protein